MPVKLLHIIGARPQFIKAAAISRAIAAHNRVTPNSSRLNSLLLTPTPLRRRSRRLGLGKETASSAECIKGQLTV